MNWSSAAVAQGEEDLLEKFFRDIGTLGDGGNLNEAVGPGFRFEADFHQRANRIFTLFGETHGVYSIILIDFASVVAQGSL